MMLGEWKTDKEYDTMMDVECIIKYHKLLKAPARLKRAKAELKKMKAVFEDASEKMKG